VQEAPQLFPGHPPLHLQLHHPVAVEVDVVAVDQKKL
jgi:hypothetical protein